MGGNLTYPPILAPTRIRITTTPDLQQLQLHGTTSDMSHHARIEEVEDSDPEESDLSQLMNKPFFDPTARVPASQFNNREPGESSSSFAQPAASWPPPPSAPAPSSSRPSGPTGSSVPPPPYPAEEVHKRGRVGAANLSWAGNSNTQYVAASQASTYKHYQSLYPIYFDITRSRQGGRKVPKSHAVENPLAREIVDACALLGLKVVFEPGKTHPKDWANPGRVRVLLKGEDGLPMVPGIQNSEFTPTVSMDWH